MDQKKIIILVVLIVAIGAMYYFVQKGKEEKPEATTDFPTLPEDFVMPTTFTEPLPGEMVADSTPKEIMKYYSGHMFENPFLNPIIMPGWIIKQLKKKKKKN